MAATENGGLGMADLNGGQIIARQLKAAGIDTAFGVVAGPMIEVMAAMEREGIKVVNCRHEVSGGLRRLGLGLGAGEAGRTRCRLWTRAHERGHADVRRHGERHAARRAGRLLGGEPARAGRLSGGRPGCLRRARLQVGDAGRQPGAHRGVRAPRPGTRPERASPAPSTSTSPPNSSARPSTRRPCSGGRSDPRNLAAPPRSRSPRSGRRHARGGGTPARDYGKGRGLGGGGTAPAAGWSTGASPSSPRRWGGARFPTTTRCS